MQKRWEWDERPEVCMRPRKQECIWGIAASPQNFLPIASKASVIALIFNPR
jgi:hypothetical protein